MGVKMHWRACFICPGVSALYRLNELAYFIQLVRCNTLSIRYLKKGCDIWKVVKCGMGLCVFILNPSPVALPECPLLCLSAIGKPRGHSVVGQIVFRH